MKYRICAFGIVEPTKLIFGRVYGVCAMAFECLDNYQCGYARTREEKMSEAIRERLNNLKDLLEAEKKSPNPSQRYMEDLFESIASCEQQLINHHVYQRNIKIINGAVNA